MEFRINECPFNFTPLIANIDTLFGANDVMTDNALISSNDNGIDFIDSECLVDLIYTDSDGDTTLRTITIISVEKFSQNNEDYFKCFCHLRQEDRIFRCDRVKGFQLLKCSDQQREIIQPYLDRYSISETGIYTHILLQKMARNLLIR